LDLNTFVFSKHTFFSVREACGGTFLNLAQFAKSNMLSEEARKELTKQGYRLVGDHSAVKTCGWTRNMIRGRGGCYKLKFYGIMSHQCMQMTTSISCANRCTFCWRGYKAPIAKEWKWKTDDPSMIAEQSQEEHHQLLVGFKGDENANRALYKGSTQVKHVALSLTGEPIIYPKINELLRLFNEEGISTFLVTNAQYPNQIRNLAPVTQLYVSLDAPTKEMLKRIDVPLFKDYYERLLASLDALAAKQQRTTIRLTLVKEQNMSHHGQYAELIHRGDPDFIEVKAYMHVGPSQERLSKENMPNHDEVVAFTKELLPFLPDYDIVTDHVPSRVVMLAKKSYRRDGRWYTWINFPKYQELSVASDDFSVDDYLLPTPQVGLTASSSSAQDALSSAEEGDEMDLDD
jgi:tRNA wybutosine-synthesizing protein 1